MKTLLIKFHQWSTYFCQVTTSKARENADYWISQLLNGNSIIARGNRHILCINGRSVSLCRSFRFLIKSYKLQLKYVFDIQNLVLRSCASFRVNPHFIVSLNVKEFLARSRCHIWNLSDSNGIRTHNHLVRKQTLNHLAKLTKWLSCIASTYLYGAFDYMLV